MKFRKIIEKIFDEKTEEEVGQNPLQEKFVQHMAANKAVNAGISSNDDLIEELRLSNEQLRQQLKKERKEREKTENKIEALKSKVTDDKKLKEEIGKLKETIFDLKSKEAESTNKLQGEVSKLSDQVKKMSLELETSKKRIQVLTKTNETLSSNIGPLKQHVESLKKQNKEYQEAFAKRKNSVPRDTSLEISKLNEKIQSLSKELSAYKEKAKSFEKQSKMSSSIEDAIHYLDSMLFNMSVEEFFVMDELIKKAARIRRKVRAAETQTSAELDNVSFGYIFENNCYWYFSDLEDNVYCLHDIASDIESDIPAKVRIDGERAVLLETYPIQKNKNGSKMFKVKNNKNKNIEIEYSQFDKVNVLIVGARNKSIYLNRLKKHGLDAVWHDPFEESGERLAAKYKTADIVLVCTSHVSHDIYGQIDSNDTKVQFVKKDNADVIAARVRFATINNLKKEAE